jgi:hypothetical protein
MTAGTARRISLHTPKEIRRYEKSIDRFNHGSIFWHRQGHGVPLRE